MIAILVADDEDIRELVLFKLEAAGFDVTAVDNGLSALEAARDRRPDLAPGCSTTPNWPAPPPWRCSG